jgi:hypothetical protein
MVMHNDTNKGEEICIIDGKYKKHNGWHWAGKDDTPKFTHVIVLLENGQELGTKVKKGNVRAWLMPPTNYVEAALQQHVDIDCALHKVCKLLAKCNLMTGHEEAAQHFFMKRMETAISQQAAEGSKATWYHVDFSDASKTEAEAEEMSKAEAEEML